MYDGNGNVGQLADSDGKIGAKYEYDPYGNVITVGGSEAANNPIRFSTKYWDDETGLGYWGRRYHYPKLGRWTNRDPITETGGLNLYTYCLNSPLDLVDPLGLIDSLRTKIFALIARGKFTEAIGLAEAGGLTALATKLQQAQSSIQSLITKYPPSSYKCVDLANGIKKAFESAKMNPQILRLKGITDFLIDGNGKTFSVNGKHYVVRIGNRVWDAFTGTNGMLYEEYIKMWSNWMGCPPASIEVIKGLAK